MGADTWQPDSTARTFDHLLYRTRCDGQTPAGNLPNEDRRVTDCRSFVLEIVGKGLAGFFGNVRGTLSLHPDTSIETVVVPASPQCGGPGECRGRARPTCLAARYEFEILLVKMAIAFVARTAASD
jgi:hypothetical protein